MSEIKFLLKFGKREHLESLVEGNIYCSNAITFWGIEDKLKIKGLELSKRMQAVVDSYNDRRRDEAYANEVLDDVAEQLSQLLAQLKEEKNSFEGMGIDFEEKAFYDILEAIAKKFEFDYPHDKLITLSKEVKKIVDDKSKYTDWSQCEDIKAELKVDLVLILAAYGYPPVPRDEVFQQIFEQAENFKKYQD